MEYRITGNAQAAQAALEIIRAGTGLGCLPLVTEIRLHLASEPIGLWERTELAAGRAGLDPPFWGFAWAGGQALARYVLDHPETVAGHRVIEEASGGGLVAIEEAMAGAAEVTAYDIDPLAAAAVTLNTAANGVTVHSACDDILDRDRFPAAGTGVVLVADAFYQRELAARMLAFAQRSQARGAAVLVGDFGRAYLPRDRLRPLATYDVPGLGELESTDVKRTTVWALPGPG